MSDDRKAKTMQLSGNDYAKVAERLRLFRNDFPHSKTETAYDIDVDGTIVFTVWVWKQKEDLLELMKSGITDKEALRSSSDANGTAKSTAAIATDANTTPAEKAKKAKEFEKLETVALGRALAMLGYLASGEIASFEEMEEFEKFRQTQAQAMIDEAIEKIQATKTDEELTKITGTLGKALRHKAVIEAGQAQRKKLAAAVKSSPKKAETTKAATKPEAEKQEATNANN